MRPKTPNSDKNGNQTLLDVAEIFQNVSPPASPTSSRASAATPRSKRRSEKCVRGHPIRFVDIKVMGNWSLKFIAMAGKLLRKPPIAVQFFDEEEMRKVYSLIYDVFRYKNVLSEALTDVGFFALYPELRADQNRVWLLLFELYVRHFLKRHPEEADLQELIYREADLEVIADRLWEHRLKLAAAISRLRIKNGALQLSQLLPAHLKDEKVTIVAENPIISGWVNPFKLKNISVATEMLHKLGLVEAPPDEDGFEQALQSNQYKWDKLCPLFISCMPSDRSKFAQSDMVRKNFFVIQDKTFSVAPAILSRLLDYFELEGDILQTHVASPRSTAYLAALFYSINRLNNFLAFGIGSSLSEYKGYMKSLGISNIRLYSENFTKIPLDSQMLELVVGIFATPPNSFTGLADPIDLICSRGGDLDMLEVLTESTISIDGKKRIGTLLEEQKETLRTAMSHPQVQFILYETHSIVGSENQDMVQQAVENVNENVFEKHLLLYKEKKKEETLSKTKENGSLSAPSAQSTVKQPKSPQGAIKKKTARNKLGISKSARLKSPQSSIMSNSCSSGSSYISDPESDEVNIPKKELFIIADIPDMCMNDNSNLNLSTFGCYVSLLQRKEICKLDEPLLAKIAERKKQLGNADNKFFRTKSKSTDGASVSKLKDDSSKLLRNKKAVMSMVERLSRPTHASIIRSNNQQSNPGDKQNNPSHDYMKSGCTRHRHHHHSDECSQNGPSAYMSSMHLDPRAKRWWQETTHYINNLRLLERRKERFKLAQQNKEEIHPLKLSFHTSDQPSNVVTHNVIFENRLRAGKVNDNRKAYPVTVNNLKFTGFKILKNGHVNFYNQDDETSNRQQSSSSSSSLQIAHPTTISRKPLGRYLLRDSRLVLSF